MSGDPFQTWGADRRNADKVREVLTDVIESVAQQGEKALQSLGLGVGPLSRGPIATDVIETPTEVVVRLDLPGVEPAGVEVLLLGNLLTVRGKRSEAGEVPGETRHRSERPRGAFEVGVPLPVPVDDQRVSAEFQLGVLTVRMARQAPVVGRQIPVQTVSGDRVSGDQVSGDWGSTAVNPARSEPGVG